MLNTYKPASAKAVRNHHIKNLPACFIPVEVEAVTIPLPVESRLAVNKRRSGSGEEVAIFYTLIFT